MSLQTQAAHTIADAEFRNFWPTDTRKTLVRAAKTEGEMPGYAVRVVERALRDARGIEKRKRVPTL